MDKKQIDIMLETVGGLLEEQKFDGALEVYDRLLFMAPDRLDIRLGRASLLSSLNRARETFEDLNFIIDEDPEYIEAYYLRGIAYSAAGNYFSAIDDFNKAIEKDPEYAEAYYARAIAQIGLNRPGKATADLTFCINADPASAPLYMLRGQTYLGMNLIDRAIVDFCSVLELDPASSEAYLSRAGALESMGDYDTALVDYQLAVNTAPANSLYRVALARALLRKSRTVEALAELKTALVLDPGGAAPWQAIPLMLDLEPPVNLLEPMIKLAISNQASSIRFEKMAGQLTVSIEVLTLKMPLFSIGGHHILAFYHRISQLCGVDVAASKGTFQYAFAGNKYTFEMNRAREGDWELMTVNVLFKSLIDKFGFGFKFEDGFINRNNDTYSGTPWEGMTPRES